MLLSQLEAGTTPETGRSAASIGTRTSWRLRQSLATSSVADLTREELRLAAPLVHFLFGAAVGAIYGAYAERRQADTTGAGFGTTVWLAADEIAMPLLGLSDSTARRPLEMHLQSLVAHLVYGTATELTRRSVRARFDGATPRVA